MKKIAHEVPLQLLETSRKWTDYDYALVHLLGQYPEYLSFFENSIKLGRTVILDNSAFELGASFDSVDFARWVGVLKPQEYVVPDCLDDSLETMNKLDHWLANFDVPGKKIGVIQGRTYAELRACYKAMAPSVDKIAINFGSCYYTHMFPGMDPIWARAYGRPALINQLLHDNTIDTKKPHHLLGCSLPQEYAAYKHNKFKFIESIDTSNPISTGMVGRSYNSWGLDWKSDILMAENMNMPITEEMKERIELNVMLFKRFVK